MLEARRCVALSIVLELKDDGTMPSEGFSMMRPRLKVDWPLMPTSSVGSVPGLNQ